MSGFLIYINSATAIINNIIPANFILFHQYLQKVMNVVQAIATLL